VDSALLARERLLTQIEQQRRDELLEEEAYRDAVMCAWIESSAQVIEEIAC
jgi:hypothetical protein